MKWIGQHIYDLIARFRADIYIEKGLRDKDGDIGTSGQILSSTGTQTNWINAPSVGTLQTVTDNGNTTTNSIMIGSSSTPSDKLDVYGNIKLIQTQNYIKFANDFVTVMVPLITLIV